MSAFSKSRRPSTGDWTSRSLLGAGTRPGPRHPDTRHARIHGRLKTKLLRLGVLPFIIDNRIHMVPPAVVTPEEVAQTLPTYDQALAAVALRLSYNTVAPSAKEGATTRNRVGCVQHKSSQDPCAGMSLSTLC